MAAGVGMEEHYHVLCDVLVLCWRWNDGSGLIDGKIPTTDGPKFIFDFENRQPPAQQSN